MVGTGEDVREVAGGPSVLGYAIAAAAGDVADYLIARYPACARPDYPGRRCHSISCVYARAAILKRVPYSCAEAGYTLFDEASDTNFSVPGALSERLRALAAEGEATA